MGNLFLVAAGGLRGGYSDETLETLAKIAKAHQANHIIIEANFGDGMYTKLFQPILQKHHRCLVEEVKHSQQKEQRISDTLEPVLTQHRLIVDQKLIERDFESAQTDIKYSLFYQLTRLTRDRGALSHDDRLDALAMAVAYWVDHMARDNDKAVQEMRAKNMDVELRKFMGHVLGRPPRNRGWMGGNASAR